VTARLRADIPALAALAGIALTAACAQPVARSAPESLAPIHVQLTADDVAALAELLRMEDARVLDSGLIVRHLGSPTPEVRARAALAAARTGDAAAAALLLRAIADPDLVVRARAAFGIGELPDSSADAVSALSATALNDELRAAIEAVHALGKLGIAAGRVAIDSILASSPRPLLVQEALLAAWRLPRALSTHDQLVRHTRAGTDAELRWRAAYSLGRTGGPSAVAPLLALLADPDHRVRMNAVRGLRAAVADSAGLRAAALEALLTAAQDAHPHVRINALNQLPGYRVPERAAPVLATALDDSDTNVAVAAALALQQDGPPVAGPSLRAIVQSARPDGLRTAALHALARADSASAAAIATQWADSTRWLLRMHAARALGRGPRDTALSVLHRLARDTHYLVASEALASVRLLADTLRAARPLYVERLGAPHPLVRAAALRGLAQHAGPADLDLLLQAFEAARADSMRDAAVAAVHALAALRRAGVPVERSFFLRFEEAPADAILRRTIADSIGTPPASWGDALTGVRVREPAFYDDAIRRYVAPVLAGAAPPRVVIDTPHGEITLELAAADAPLTVHNFISLIERGYYTDTRWHRVVPNFVIQDGDPRGDGSGGPGYAIRDEINPLRYVDGTLGMALAGPDTGGSQFFITHSPQPHLDGGYTVFGRVINGMDVVLRVVQEEPILGMRVLQ
jgi:cyclophilin family peptidyl-prolyl cis-trans isomerase/HEAT repeat protein